MPFDGNGNYSPPSPEYPAVSGTTIEAADWNAIVSDIASALTSCVTRDGQSPMAAALPMAGNKITSLLAATALSDAANFGDVQGGRANYVTGVAGSNAITGTVPYMTAYTAGQVFVFIPASSNTGAATLNINGIGAKSISLFGSTALGPGDLYAGKAVAVMYDSVNFALLTTPLSAKAVLSPAGGANADFTIPAWARRINISISSVSFSGVPGFLGLRLGDAGGIESAGYSMRMDPIGSAAFSSVSEFLLSLTPNGSTGEATLSLLDASTFTWIHSGIVHAPSTGNNVSAGSKSLSAALTSIRLFDTSGNNFSAGKIAVTYQ